MKPRTKALLLAAVALLAPPALAEEDPTLLFRLISAETAEQLERRLRSAVDDGFRLASAARVGVDGKPRFVILMQRASPDEVVDYEVLSGSGDLRDRDEIRVAATQGFRLLPEGVLVQHIVDFWLPPSAYDDQTILLMERTAPVTPREYDAVAFGRYEDFYQALNERRAQGFSILGMWNSGRRLLVLLERSSAQEGSGASKTGDDDPYRLLMMATRKVLKIKLGRAASNGYRVIGAADPSTTGPPLLLMERTDKRAQKIEYRFLSNLKERLRKDKFQKKMNKRTRKGWRITPAGVTDTTVTLQRVSSERWPGEYLTLSSDEAPGLPLALAQAAERGFRVVRMFVEPNIITVLLERLPGEVGSAHAR